MRNYKYPKPPHLYVRPSSTNRERFDHARDLFGLHFEPYIVYDYEGHGRVDAEIAGDVRDAQIMRELMSAPA